MNYMFNYIAISLILLSCNTPNPKKETSNWTAPNIKGHWQLYNTEIVEEVPFLNLKKPERDPQNITTEESPWDFYQEYELVFENDSMYKLNYPIEAQNSIPYTLNDGYLQLKSTEKTKQYPIELINDTLILYTPIKEYGFFKEKYLPTKFNDSTLNIMKKYGVNYPELAGTWLLVREEDYDYGTHYELKYPYKIPNSIHFSRQQMIHALNNEKIYMMPTNGTKKPYFFHFQNGKMYLTPDKWYKKEEPPMIYFYKQ